jgi:hypothetical protein
MDRTDLHDLETLLHAILNGGKEVGDLLRKNCEDFLSEDIVDEIDRLYDIVKSDNEDYEGEY